MLCRVGHRNQSINQSTIERTECQLSENVTFVTSASMCVHDVCVMCVAMLCCAVL